jgi:hypothetical protein
MKKFLKSILAASTAILLFAGCSDIALTDAKVQDSNSNEKCVLTIGVEDFEKLNITSTGRAINPYDFEDATHPTSIAKFKITGTSQLGNESISAAQQEIVFTNKKATITLSKDVWYLTLTAYKDSACTQALLKGNTRVDLSKTNSIKFVLTTDDVTTPGSISLVGTVPDSQHLVKKWEAGLYDINDNSLIYTAESTPATTVASDTYSDLSTNTKSFTYTKTDIITPGEYAFKVVFYGEGPTDAAIDDIPIGVWADEIVVAPGRTTAKTWTLPDVIMKKPDAPENLKAYYKMNSDDNGFYTVKLVWTDKSFNEENFVVTVTEYTGTAYDSLSAVTPAIELGKDFYSSDMRVSGSLSFSNTECEIKLPAGKLYDFKIAAQNIVGTSTAVARMDTTDPNDYDTNPTTDPDYDAAYELVSSTVKISKSMVTFELAGGTLKDSTHTYTDYYIPAYQKYTGTAINLSTILAINNASYPTVAANSFTLAIINDKVDGQTGDTEDDSKFARWLDATDAPVTALNNWKNLIVRADYGTNVSYTIDDSYEDVTTTAKYSDSTNTTPADCKFTGTENGITLSASVTNPKITFAAPDVTNAANVVITSYDYIKVTLRKVDYERTYGADSNTLDVNISSLPSGIYSVVVYAHKTGDRAWSMKSDTFQIKIVR